MSRALSGSACFEIDWMCAPISESRRRSSMGGKRDTPRGGGSIVRAPVPSRLRRGTGETRTWESSGLRNPRDALLIERHLARDLVVRNAFDVAQAIDDQACLDGVALKLLVLADCGQLLGRAV